MGAALQMMGETLTEAGWKFNALETGDGLYCSYRTDAGAWGVVVQEREAAQQLIVYSVFPKQVPEAHRADVMTFITIANYALPIGNFELDLRDGELRFKSSVDLEGTALNPQMAGLLVHTNIRTMQTYYLGLVEVMAGLSDPAEAVASCEEA
ncbi:MAG: YbjN domain-containing protein [Proteobacteria bacterium]|nr:YbjN domain-containing protein [Pseudomonadota bacterium]